MHIIVIYIGNFHRLAKDPETVLICAVTDVRIAVAGRGIEAHEMMAPDIKKTTIHNSPCYIVKSVKCKQTSSTVAGWDPKNTAFITGEMEIAALDQYLACFTPQQLVDPNYRLFRKLKMVQRTLTVTNQVVGKNTIAQYGKRIATLLNLPNPDSYKGHTFKRTGLTWAGDSGLSTTQMKGYRVISQKQYCKVM